MLLMSLPQIRQKPDGQRIVVDFFSGRRYPLDEEVIILAQASRAEEAKEKPQDSDQQH